MVHNIGEEWCSFCVWFKNLKHTIVPDGYKHWLARAAFGSDIYVIAEESALQMLLTVTAIDHEEHQWLIELVLSQWGQPQYIFAPYILQSTLEQASHKRITVANSWNATYCIFFGVVRLSSAVDYLIADHWQSDDVIVRQLH
jgi:hypothetical protein